MTGQQQEVAGPRRGDLNPRATCTASRLSVVRNRPLCHASVVAILRRCGLWPEARIRRANAVEHRLFHINDDRSTSKGGAG